MRHRALSAALGRALLVVLTATLGDWAARASAAVVCVAPPAVTTCPNHTIQAGVDAAQPGDLVKIAPGLYFESVTIPAGKDNLQLLGSGKTATIIDHDVPNAGSYGIGIGAHGVSVANLGIQNGTYYAIYGSADRIKVSGVRLVGGAGGFAGGIGILGNGVQIVASEIRARPGFGIYLLGDDAVIKGNVIAQVGRGGIYLSGRQGQVVANKITTAGLSPPDNADITGIYVDGTPSTVASNVLENVGFTGSDAIGALVVGSEPTVQGNVLRWAGRLSVGCPLCNGGKVGLNSVLGSSAYGLTVATTLAVSPASTLLVQGNRIAETASNGLIVDGPASLPPGAGMRVTQNSVTDSSTALDPLYSDCVLVFGSGHTFTSNIAKGCARVGFHTVADDVLFTANQTIGVGTNGFAVDGYNNGAAVHFGITLNANRATASAGDGFALYDSNGGTDTPVGTTGSRNVGLLNRQDFCSEGEAVTLGTFATNSTTCDIKQ